MKRSYLLTAAVSLPLIALLSWFASDALVRIATAPTKSTPAVALLEPEPAPPPPAPTPQAPADPYREIRSSEMTACWMYLRDQMNDPRSFRVLSKDRRNGGIVEFTATNGFGGTIRQTYRCTTGQLS